MKRCPKVAWRSGSAAELDDPAAIALGGSGCGQLFELPHCSTFSSNLLAKFPACVGFAVEGLRNRSGTARIAKQKHFDFEVAAVVGHAQHVADSNFARGFCGLAVRLNPAEFTGAGGEGSSFKKSGGPEPFVDANRGHDLFLATTGAMELATAFGNKTHSLAAMRSKPFCAMVKVRAIDREVRYSTAADCRSPCFSSNSPSKLCALKAGHSSTVPEAR